MKEKLFLRKWSEKREGYCRLQPTTRSGLDTAYMGLYGAYIYGGTTLILYSAMTLYMRTPDTIIFVSLGSQETLNRLTDLPNMHGVNLSDQAFSYKLAYSNPARSQQYYVQRPYGPIIRHLQDLSTSYLSHHRTYIICIYYYYDCSHSYRVYIILDWITWLKPCISATFEVIEY